RAHRAAGPHGHAARGRGELAENQVPRDARARGSRLPPIDVNADIHHVKVRPGPVAGVHAVLTHSARGFGRHWHDSFGFGVMDEGAHRTASGRGPVLATAGRLIATNPGEVHDGVPVG